MGSKAGTKQKPHTRSRSQKVMVLRQEKSRIYTATHDQKIKKNRMYTAFSVVLFSIFAMWSFETNCLYRTK